MASCHEPNPQDEVKFECKLCDTFDDVNSYCRDCMFNFCDACLKTHSKLHNDHEVVRVFDGILEKRHFDVMCKIHSQRFRFYCEICKVNTCVECLTTGHKGHAVQKVSEHSQTLKDNTKQDIDTQQRRLSTLQEHVRSLEQHESNFVKRIQVQIETVRTETNKKRKLLEIEEEKIIKQLKDEQKIATENLRELKKELQDIDNKIRKMINSMNNELNNIPDAAVLQFVHDSEPKLKLESINKTVELPNPSTFVLSVPGVQGNVLLGSLSKNATTSLIIETFITEKPSQTESDQQITSLYPLDSDKTLQQTPIDPPPSLRRDLQVLTKFIPARGNSIYDICSTDDDLLWVSTSGSLLFLVDKTGDIKSKVKMPDDPLYIAVTCRGDVIVSTEGHVIYHVTRQGHISTLVDLSPDIVRDITTTRHGDVFACVVDSGSVCKVKKFTAEGDFVLEVDTNLFTARYQWFVHSVSGDTVCIQDGYPEYDDVCNLTFVDAEGQLITRVTRTGHLREHTERILWDGHGHVVTGTEYGEYIHVFDGDGTCRQSYHVKESERIYGLCLGKGDVILIGTETGEVIVAKYLQ